MVIVIDDNKESIKLVSDLLHYSEIDVRSYSSGSSFLDDLPFLIENHSILLIILDIHMPGFDGFQVLNKIRRISDMDNVPVMAMTALAMKDEQIKIKSAGFDYYFSKPINIKLFLDSVFSVLQRSKV